MSPAEYMELLAVYNDLATSHAMNGIYLVFAFLVSSYLVGARLSRLQLAALLFLYTVFLYFPVSGAINSIQQLIALAHEFAKQHPEAAAVYPAASRTREFLPALLGSAFLAGWLVSLAFMFSTRRRKDS